MYKILSSEIMFPYVKNTYISKILYDGKKTVKERGFKVGNHVWIGADYSEPTGVIAELNDEFPYIAKIELHHTNGGITTCWIKSCYLVLRDD